MKYTLFVRREYIPSGPHYLYVGDWLLYDPDIIILVHGSFSKLEYEQLRQNGRLPVFQSMSYSWIGLYDAYHSRKYPDTTKIGYLEYITDHLYGGRLYVQ